MPSARKTLLAILEQHGGHLDITTLAKEMDKTGVLGFGVEAADVVYALRELGLVTYDRDTETVALRK
jgi:hypothetical protein